MGDSGEVNFYNTFVLFIIVQGVTCDISQVVNGIGGTGASIDLM